MNQRYIWFIVLLLVKYSVGYDSSWAKQQSYFAAAAYCSPLDLLAWNCTACTYNPKTVLTGVAYDPIANTFAYIATNIDLKTITVAFRGTMGKDVRNWITNIRTDKANATFLAPNLLVHEGFLKSYTILRKELMLFLRAAIKLFPSFPIAVTGHSLGGALAILCAADISANEKNWNITSVITFGSPRVGNLDFSQFYDGRLGNITFREVHSRDVVPHVPIRKMNYNHVAREVWYSPDFSQYIVCDDSGEDPKCSKTVELLPSIDEHLVYHNYPISSYCCMKQGCSDGLWGSCCDNPCPNLLGDAHCFKDWCYQENGKCPSNGESTCIEGWWSADFCDKQCPKTLGKAHCYKDWCYRDSGLCPSNGEDTCMEGWWSAEYCDKPCPKTQGKAHCYKDWCYRDSGLCPSNGEDTCKEGWWSADYCDRVCPKKQGKAHCYKDWCYRDSGLCPSNGEDTCEEGWWSKEYCDQECPKKQGKAHCYKDWCYRDSGKCPENGNSTCIDGWWGKEFCDRPCSGCKKGWCYVDTGACPPE
jgi:hypothetical protein